MAKRKRESGTSSTPRKAKQRAHPHGTFDPDQEYLIKAIIKETKTKYLFQWENNPDTGEAYEDTWGPKSDANEYAIADWESRKSRKQAAKSTPGRSSARPAAAASQPQSDTPVRRGRGRPRKSVVIESSPTPPPSEHTNSDGIIELEIGESQQSPAESTLFVPEHSPLPQNAKSLAVQVSDPPSSYDRGAYHRFDPQSSSNGTATARNPGSSAPLSATHQHTDPRTTRVVPDSQSQGQSQILEESTFRGFSPTQQLQAEIQSSLHPEAARFDPDFTTQIEDTAVGVTEHPGNDESGATVSGEQLEEENPEELYNQVQSQEPQSIAGAQPLPHSQDQFEEPSQDLDSAQVSEQSAQKGGLVQEVLLSAPHITSPRESQVSAHQEERPAQLTEAQSILFNSHSHSHSQEQEQEHTQGGAEEEHSEQLELESPGPGSPSGVLSQHTSPREPDYIVISAEEDPSSSLDLLTQPEYNPPPAGQHPPPSSLWGNTAASPTPRIKGVEEPTELDTTQSSSFPFQTQPPFKVEQEPRIRAIFSPFPKSSGEFRSSSQIPAVPSQSLVTIGESAPARLNTPSTNSITTASMDQQPPSNSGKPSGILLAQLNALYDQTPKQRPPRRSYTPIANPAALPTTSQSAAAISNGTSVPSTQPVSAIPSNVSAEIAASQPMRHAAGGRSPSAVPALAPEKVITKEEMRTTGRVSTLVPDGNDTEAVNNEHSILTVSANSGPAQNDAELINVHVVPIPFGKVQRDEYKSRTTSKYYSGPIQQFLDNESQNSQSVPDEAFAALHHLKQVTIHPDLINNEVQSQLSAISTTSEQVQWDADISCKFRFLRDVLIQLRSQDIHVVVATRGYAISEMLDRFLQGLEMPLVRLATSPDQEAGFRISILDLDVALDPTSRADADVVIAMDGTCDAQDPLIQAVRRSEVGDWAPLLTLVVPCTVEHIERSLLPSIAESTRVRTLLRTAQTLQGAAGRLTPGQAFFNETAVEIASFLASPSTMEWPIQELGILDNLDSQTETDVDHTSRSDPSLVQSSGAAKRNLDIDMETSTGSATKRPRVPSVDAEQMPSTINPQDIEITHISDSLGKVTQSDPEFGLSVEVEQLRQLLSEKQDQLDEHVKVMAELQYRHEAQRVELANTKKERDEAILTAQVAVQRMTTTATQNAELRTERTSLKQLLEDANSKLLDHSVPERREFETLRLAMEQETLAKEKAKRQAEQGLQDNEWTREQYQNASSRARELTQQNAELEARLSVAEDLAAGEQAKARKASNDERNNLLAKENKKLKAMLRDRENSMRTKDEDIARLKEAGRGRIGTRGSSVPRSPRMGSPALKGRTSRQGSPSAGDVVKSKHLHPLRNG